MRDSTFIAIFTVLFMLALGLGIQDAHEVHLRHVQQALDRRMNADNIKTARYITSSAVRVARAVITLPDGNQLVQLADGHASYTPSSEPKEKNKGMVSVGPIMARKIILGTAGGTLPRLDLFVPMKVSLDQNGGSTYVVLFGDRGDSVIERSYVRLGGDASVSLTSIGVLAPDSTVPQEEYRVDIAYTVKNGKDAPVHKETTIPIIDAHFSTQGVVNS